MDRYFSLLKKCKFSIKIALRLCCYIKFTCLPRLLDLLKRTPLGKLFGFVQFAAFVVVFFSIFVFTKIRVRIFSEAFKSDERMRCFQRLGLETSKRPWQVWKIFDKGVGGGVQTLIQKIQNFYLFFFFPFFTPKSVHAKKKINISKFWIFRVGFLIGAHYLMGSWFLISSKKRTTGLVGPLMGEAGGRGVGTPRISWLTAILWVTTWKKVTDRLSLFVMEIAAESLTQFITIPPLSAR